MEVFLLQNTTLQFFVFSDPTCSGKVVFAEAEPAHDAAAGQGLGHERQGWALQSAHLHYDAVHEGVRHIFTCSLPNLVAYFLLLP